MHKNSVTNSTPKHSESTKLTPDDQSSNKCHICLKSLTFRRKITCSICLNNYCSDHCTKRRHISETDELINICDSCNIEETKKDIIEEINEEIKRISKELESIKEGNDQLFKEHYNNTASINNIEMEIKKQEWGSKKQEEELLNQLESEQTRGRNARTAVDVMRKALDDASRNEKLMSDACIETEAEIEVLKVQNVYLSDQRNEMISEIEKLQGALRGSIGIDQLRKILCVKCLNSVNQNMDKGIEIDPGDSVSLVSYSTDKPSGGCLVI